MSTKISGGGIAGIVIATVVVAAIVVFCGVYFSSPQNRYACNGLNCILDRVNGYFTSLQDCQKNCGPIDSGIYKINSSFGCVSNLGPTENKLTFGNCVQDSGKLYFKWSAENGTVTSTDGTNRLWTFNINAPVTLESSDDTKLQTKWSLGKNGKIYYNGSTDDTNMCISNSLIPTICTDPAVTIFNYQSVAYACKYGS